MHAEVEVDACGAFCLNPLPADVPGEVASAPRELPDDGDLRGERFGCGQQFL